MWSLFKRKRRIEPEAAPADYPAPPPSEHALVGFFQHLQEVDRERDRAHPLYAEWVADGEISLRPRTTEQLRARMTSLAPLDEEVTLVFIREPTAT